MRFRADQFDQLTSAQGASTDTERARLVGITRLTLYRWRTGSTSPNVGNALLVARALGVTVERLFEVHA